MGFDEIRTDAREKQNAIDGIPNSLVFYTFSHGVVFPRGHPMAGQFAGPGLPDRTRQNTLLPEDMPAGLNLELIFLNGCKSGADGNAGRFGGRAYVGWVDEVNIVNANDAGHVFFAMLAFGGTVQNAVVAVNRRNRRVPVRLIGSGEAILRME